MTTNRRQFSRITFNNQVRLTQGHNSWLAEIVDISLKGILLRCQDWNFNQAQPLQANLVLADDTQINMTLSVRHIDNDLAGFACEFIDIDSITTLRRLVELNLGNAELLERELANLLQEAS